MRLAAMLVFLLGIASCERFAGNGGQPEPGTTDPAMPSTQSAATAGGAPEIAHIPVGKFRAGSLPGEPGRRPAREPLAVDIELGPFRIDPLPYPGVVGKPPRLGASRTEAEVLCAERQARLCTELEWERACKGPTSTTYPSGAEPCAPGSACPSGFEVREMGQRPEWTASSIGPGAEQENKPVLRGLGGQAAPAERRCAVRRAESELPATEVAFRCCYGAPNAKAVVEPTLGPAYKEVDISLDELAALLKADPATAALAEKATFFRSPDGARTVFERGPKESMGFTLTTRPLEWQPERGLRLLVLAGRSGDKTSFVVVYHVTSDRKLLAGSFIMKNEPGPVALGYAASIRPRLHFSTCWGCPGETGKILFREPEEFVLLQP